MQTTAHDAPAWKVLDATNGQEVCTLKGATGDWDRWAFSPDNRRLVAARRADRILKLWDAVTGEEAVSIAGHAFSERVECLEFDPEGRRLASASMDGSVKIWDATSGNKVRDLHGGPRAPQRLAFSADGGRLAAVFAGGLVRVWDATTDEEARTFRHERAVAGLAFSPDGKRLATCTPVGHDMSETEVLVQDPRTGQQFAALSLSKGAMALCVAFSPDGRLLAAGGADAVVKVWDTTSWQELLRLRPYEEFGSVHGIAFSPDGRRLAAAGYSWRDELGRPGAPKDAGSSEMVLKVWEVPTGKELLSLGSPRLRRFIGHAMARVTFSPDGERLAAVLGGRRQGETEHSLELIVWDAAAGNELFFLSGAHTSVAFSADDRFLAAPCGDDVRVLDARTGAELRRLQNAYGPAAFTPDGKRLATAGPGKTVRLWDPATGKEVFALRRATDTPLDTLAFSPKGWLLAASSPWDTDNVVTIWNFMPLD
jgi:WD40 repeat protein